MSLRPGSPLVSRSRISAARSGFTLLECTAAAAILGVALVVSLQLQAAAALQRRAAEQRQLAEREVENVMERLTAEDWSALDDAAAGRLALSERVTHSLHGAQLAINVTEEQVEDGIRSKRIHVSLHWQGRSGEQTAPVQLTAWAFDPATNADGDATESDATEETP